MGPQGKGGIDFADRCLDSRAMSVRTRGLDIKAGAAKLKADRAARLEAEQSSTTGIDAWQPAATCCGRPRYALR
jgi:hypothetical protein